MINFEKVFFKLLLDITPLYFFYLRINLPINFHLLVWMAGSIPCSPQKLGYSAIVSKSPSSHIRIVC